MKRLFLASSGLEYIKEFVGGTPSKLNMLFISTAGNLDDNVWWIDKDRDVLARMGFQITELDIEQATPNELKSSLSTANIVYIAGGNSFHLLKQIRVTGFDKLLAEYVYNGGLYAGASAGALVAGADIGSISSIDEPEKVKGLKSTKGLGFVPIVPIPHYDINDPTKKIGAIRERYGKDFEIILLTDDQALVVENDMWQVVDSKRSKLELEWFRKSH